ncbi:uncharacterized protein LOC115710700 [Cannabis sativa]|uniref:uncharacterized protein LOC115710700 n=1 Tax=Cannabis sativa TaxID=3483 RepID=UPI0011DFBC81|nr:uncharacterized protein LOC115710700 [Cannabis sativa]
MALLGKQCWRLLVNDTSLVSKFFKAKYYANGTLLSTELDDNPSFIWRSIFEAKGLIQAGATPTIAFFKMNSREWDEEIIKDLFDDRDQELIFSLQLSSTAISDYWSWRFERKGHYSVKSAYQFLQEEKGAWPITGATGVWKELWSLKVHLKVSNFLWRAASGSLPTCVQLKKRHVLVNPTCPLCLTTAETIFYVLVGRVHARACWNRTILDVGGNMDDDFINLLFELQCRGREVE